MASYMGLGKDFLMTTTLYLPDKGEPINRVLLDNWNVFWRAYNERIAAANYVNRSIPYIRVVPDFESDGIVDFVKTNNIEEAIIEPGVPINSIDFWFKAYDYLGTAMRGFIGMYDRFGGNVYSKTSDFTDQLTVGSDFPVGSFDFINDVGNAISYGLGVYQADPFLLSPIIDSNVDGQYKARGVDLLSSVEDIGFLRSSFDDLEWGKNFIETTGRTRGEQFGGWIIEDTVRLLHTMRNVVFYPNIKKVKRQYASGRAINFQGDLDLICDAARIRYEEDLIDPLVVSESIAWHFAGDEIFLYETSATALNRLNATWQSTVQETSYSFVPNQSSLLSGKARLYGITRGVESTRPRDPIYYLPNYGPKNTLCLVDEQAISIGQDRIDFGFDSNQTNWLVNHVELVHQNVCGNADANYRSFGKVHVACCVFSPTYSTTEFDVEYGTGIYEDEAQQP